MYMPSLPVTNRYCEFAIAVPLVFTYIRAEYQLESSDMHGRDTAHT